MCQKFNLASKELRLFVYYSYIMYNLFNLLCFNEFITD